MEHSTSVQVVVLALLSIYLIRWSIPSIQALFSSIPGPFLSKLSVWYLRYHEIKGQREVFIEGLHKQYGDIVYVSPGEVSVRSADGLRDVFATNRLDKPYIIVLEQWGVSNLAGTKDAALHMARRKIVAPVYSAAAIASAPRQNMFKMLVRRFKTQIDLQAAENDDRQVDVYLLLRWLAADIMSYVIFGESNCLNTLENKDDQKTMSFTLPPIDQRASDFPVLMMGWYPAAMRWLLSLGLVQSVLRGMGEGEAGMQDYALKNYNAEMEKPVEHTFPTHMQLLLEKYRKNGLSAAIPEPKYIASDSTDHFVAGCLTSADASSWLIWEMALPKNREHQLRLRNELQEAGIFPGVEAELSQVNKLPFLDAALKETLRRHPPIPFSQTRQVKPGQDIQVLGHQIYPGVKVGAQHYSVHRRPSVFPEPETWDPSRWEGEHDTPEYHEKSRHFWPFGNGQRMCIGMHIAWAEIRLAAAAVFANYDVSMPSAWFDEQGELLLENRRQNLFPFYQTEPIIFKELS